MGIGSSIGSILGGAAGDWLSSGFKKGGKVPGKKGTPKIAKVHSGEVIIPNSMPKLQKEALKIINAKKKK